MSRELAVAWIVFTAINLVGAGLAAWLMLKAARYAEQAHAYLRDAARITEGARRIEVAPLTGRITSLQRNGDDTPAGHCRKCDVAWDGPFAFDRAWDHSHETGHAITVREAI